MITALVGYTGFVGSNLAKSYQFDYLFNSKNIEEAYGLKPDLLVYAGVRAEMFIANAQPEEDMARIKEAINNIIKIGAKRVVLISSVAVYDSTKDVDEDTAIESEKLLPYGKNRLYLENWVLDNCEKCLVVRLPAIYGDNLKKNFIYDYIHVCPAMLNQSKFNELRQKSLLIEQCYAIHQDGFYHYSASDKDTSLHLKQFFEGVGFSALNFTDSRSVYQFYHLSKLWNDILVALDNDISLLNIVTEPIRVSELYMYLCGQEFTNTLNKEPFAYRIRSKHAMLFGGQDGYFISKEEELGEIKAFVDAENKKLWR